MSETLWVLRMVREQHHRDDEGRPVREGRTPKEHLRADEIEYKSCPFAGTRYLHANPMNVSALRQTSAHWDEVTGALAFLRELYADAHGGYGPDVLDIWRVSQLGSALPWWFILRGRVPPAYAANLAKVMLGAGVWGQAVFARMFRERMPVPSPLTSAAILELAEATDTLVGESEVCSAPATMIRDFFDVLTEAAPAHACPLAEEREPLLLFGAHYTAFKQLVYAYHLARRFLYADVASVRGVEPELGELIASPCEPPDFFTVEPSDPAALALSHRGAWFSALAQLIVPIAPDGSDAELRDAGARLAAVMANSAPPRFVEITADVKDPVVARALAHWVELDGIFARALRVVEDGFRRAGGGAPYDGEIDAAARDRCLLASPRAYFASLAPAIGGGASRS
ncbi:MAG: hypothetical protein KIT31_16570 [Deltaproteobacteria bacterium]|nr:hypothetical protein [Deltaproteobacteria bacterium]